MADVLGIAAALRASVDVDDATWSVFVDALGDAALAGAHAGVEAVLEQLAERNGTSGQLDFEVDLRPPD
ncbi:MAG TPA: hypothetical protein VHF89_07320 [Solirubrobacteraceae bacterium]|nr:hypothetical protein [Solirubrobacteraceae bacterium]